MTGQLIDGKAAASALKEQVKRETAELIEAGVRPGLAVVLVGDDPASQIYVRNKARECERAGMHSEVIRMPAATEESELLQTIDRLNRDRSIHGILVQLPLPKHIDENKVIEAISVDKDVDGFHPINVGRMTIGTPSFLPCTPAGIIELIKRTGVQIEGKHAVVVGRSNIVGKPAALLLLREHATVTICHSRTPKIEQITSQADILVVAVGIARMIKKQHIKPGAIVIDVGMNRLDDGMLTGDVDYDEVKETAGYITPVPGGVGPMTIAMLLHNTLQSAKRSAQS